MAIGDRIKALRKEHGLTQSDLANAMGVTASMIGQYETGVRTPKCNTIERIAKALSVSIAELTEEVTHVDLGPIAIELREKYGLSNKIALSIVDDCALAFSPLFRNDRFSDLLCCLNEEGKRIAYERVRELTEIARYQLQTTDDK